METQLHTLSKIFTERLFRIPDYQRGYAWGEKQLKEFWADIEQLGIGQNHYTGVLTLESVPDIIYKSWHDDLWIIEAKNYQPFFIVDGQQRLTTSIVLVQVILENIEENGRLNYTEKSEIQKKFIFDSKDSGISRSYIFGYEKDNPSYEFLKSKVFCERSSGDVEETIYTENLRSAKQFFYDRTKGMASSDLEILYKKVTQHLLFNIFTIADDVEVCVAFETMNNRGKRLSYLELLKNRLIYLSLKFDEETYEREKLRRAINDCWKSIYHSLGKNKEKPLDDDKFLSTHYITYFGDKSTTGEGLERTWRYSGLVRENFGNLLLENIFVPKNILSTAAEDVRIDIRSVYNYVSSLQDSVKTWYNIFNPFDSDYQDDVKIWLDKINKIGMDAAISLILSVFLRMTSESKRVYFLQSLERYLFVMTLGDKYYVRSAIFHALFSMTADITSGKLSSDKVAKFISDTTNNMVRNPEFIKDVTVFFRNEGFYEWSAVRYFLFEYNLDLQENSKTTRAKIFWPEFVEDKKDFISIEHIYPQQARHEYWTRRFSGLSQRQRTSLRNSIGNLLPLSKPKNASLSNKPFPDKVDNKAQSSTGYRYGSYAENEITKYPEWNPDYIIKRGLKMLHFLEKRWGLDFGGEERKLFMLGVDIKVQSVPTDAGS